MQEAWDTYMQPPNLGIDPANNLWSSNSPNNNLFSSMSSPEATAANGHDASVSAHSSLNPNIYPTQEVGGVMSGKMDTAGGGAPMLSQGPQLSADSGFGGSGSEANAGEVFMGLSSPQPGGVPGWQWKNKTGSLR
jgi:hypothetical protein